MKEWDQEEVIEEIGTNKITINKIEEEEIDMEIKEIESSMVEEITTEAIEVFREVRAIEDIKTIIKEVDFVVVEEDLIEEAEVDLIKIEIKIEIKIKMILIDKIEEEVILKIKITNSTISTIIQIQCLQKMEDNHQI
jgi:hypothetical protein